MNSKAKKYFIRSFALLLLSSCIFSSSIGQKITIGCEDVDSDSDSVFVLNTMKTDILSRPFYGYEYPDKRTIKYYNNGFKQNRTMVNMVDGVYPYTMSNGFYTERGIESESNTAYHSKPGIYKIIIEDSIGMKDSCYSKIHMPSIIDFTTANENKISFLKEFFTATFSIKGFGIKYKFNTQSGVVQTFKDLPETCPNCESIVLSFVDSKDMKEYHKLTVNIDSHRIGDGCDDNDPCTERDVIRENGICLGKSKIDSFELYTSYAENCFSKKATIYTAHDYPYQKWSDGSEGSRSMTTSIYEPTYVRVTVKDENGCEMTQETEVLPKTKVIVNAQKTIICSDESIRLSVSQSEKFKKIVWQDEFGNFLDTVRHYIDIDKEGTYSVSLKTEDCYKTGDITIKSNTYLTKNKIQCVDNFICDDSSVLKLRPNVDFTRNEGEVIWKFLAYEDYIKGTNDWEILERNTNSTTAREAGVYSVDILSPEIQGICRSSSYDEIRIMDDLSYKLIRRYLQQLRLVESIFEFDRFDSTEYQLISDNNSEVLECNLSFSEHDKGLWLKTLDNNHGFLFQKQVHRHFEKLCRHQSDYLPGVVRNINCKDIPNLIGFLDEMPTDKYNYLCLYFIEEPRKDSQRRLVHVFVSNGLGYFDGDIYNLK